MTIHYDKVADAIYFLMKRGVVAKTMPVNEYLNIDFAEDGSVIGVEILDASSQQGVELQRMIQKGIPLEITEYAAVSI